MDFVDVSTLSFEQAVRRVAFDSVAQKVKLIAEFDATMETKNKETYFDEGISHYKSLKQKKLVNLNPILEEIKDKMEVVAQKINSYDRPLVMNHNDFQPRNMFFAHDDIVVIDWEFIGLNYEFADLAAYSIFFCLNEEDDFYLLTKYLQYVPSRDDEGYYKMVKLMTRVLYILSFFELVDYIPEVESIKYFKHYAALFAQDTISDSSDFFYEFSMSQLQELRREYEKFESLQ